LEYCSDRNSGPRILEYTHRGLSHIRIENEALYIVVLADKGADIVSFEYKPGDTQILLAMPGGIRESATFIPTSDCGVGAFFDYYPGGWQDALPGGNPKTIEGAQTGLHGEACCLPWSFDVIEDSEKTVSVKFSCELIRFPFYISKTLTLKNGEAKLYVDEQVKNLCGETKDLMWAQHIAFGQPFITPDCMIELGAKAFKTTSYFNSPTAYFPAEYSGEWPKSVSPDGKQVDLSKVAPVGEPHSDMYYIKDLQQGEYTVHNPSLGLGVKLSWDVDVYPYITYINVTDGLKGYPFYGRVYYIGLELWNTFSDVYDEAKANGSMSSIEPYETIETQICVEIV
jgi:hypothetical protein